MSFLNPLFLLGLAALAAPVLVHLVRRTRARRVEFPALVFVRQVPQRTIRRRTLHNLLLLALRCLAVLLAVFAFARPFFTGAAEAGESARERSSIILLDASLSMRHGGHFEEAKRRAAALVGELQTEETVALMSFGERYSVESGFTKDGQSVLAALDGLEAGYEATDYESALRGAEAFFAESKAAGAKRVFLISDFQASGWDAARANFRLGPDIRLGLIDVGGDPSANVALTNVEGRASVYGQKYADRLAVHVSNFGEEALKGVALDFVINEQTVARREFELGARDSKVVEFTDFNLAEGPNRCAVRLRSEDFAPDNEFFFMLRREAPAKALIIDGATRGGGESFYLQHALSAGEGLPFTFEVKGAGAVEPSSIPAHALVVLNDAGAVGGALAEAVNQFVEDGGRLIVAAGPRTQAESFNRAFGRIAPALLGGAARFERGGSVALTDVKADHPVFEIFRGGGRFPPARVLGYQRSEPRGGAVVLARFDDGAPALVESGAGLKGRVLLFTSTLGMSWNDLPLTPAYLPLVQQMVRYLGEQEARAWHRVGQTFAVGKGPEGSPPAVDTPGGARLKAGNLSTEGDLFVTGREPGFYRLRYAARPDFAAVNVDGREGDFSKLNAEAFLAAVTGGGPAPRAGSDADGRASAQEIEARQRLWWPLLAAALLLFAAESLLARRTKMVKMIG